MKNKPVLIAGVLVILFGVFLIGTGTVQFLGMERAGTVAYLPAMKVFFGLTLSLIGLLMGGIARGAKDK